MKKLAIITLIASASFFSGCSMQTLSNLDVQKLNNVAQEYMQKGEYDEAISRLKSILDLNPSFPQTHYNLGVAYHENEDYQNAIESYKNALNIKKDLYLANYALAISQEELGYYYLESIDDDKEDVQKDDNFSNDDKKKDKIKLPENPKEEGVNLLNESVKNFEIYLNSSKEIEEKELVLEKITQIKKEIEKQLGQEIFEDKE